MDHEQPFEHPADVTRNKVLSMVRKFGTKSMILIANAVLATGNIRGHYLSRGMIVFSARIRGVRPTKAKMSAMPGLQIEGRIAGQSKSREIDPPHRSGEVSDGMVWTSGFPTGTKWSIDMPAQPLFEAISVVYPKEFLENLKRTDPHLAQRARRLLNEQASDLRTANVRQRSIFLRMSQIDPDKPGGMVLLEACALELLAETLFGSEAEPDALGTGNAQLMKHVAELVDARLSNPPTIREIADTLRISESRLKREFSEAMGAPIGTFVTERRMNFARSLISSGVPIARVAAEVGYATPEAFSKAFRRQYGRSPREFKSNPL